MNSRENSRYLPRNRFQALGKAAALLYRKAARRGTIPTALVQLPFLQVFLQLFCVRLAKRFILPYNECWSSTLGPAAIFLW